MVGSNGLEPSTSRLSGVCSNQLSYEPILLFTFKVFGGGKRDRTADPLLAGQVLYQLSYAPITAFLKLHSGKHNTCVASTAYKINAPKQKVRSTVIKNE